MRHFDYERVAREAGIPEVDVGEIVQAMRREFAGDDMLAELHVLRACLAVRDRRVTLADVLGRRAA